MTEHKWLRPRNWNDGPMSAPRKPEPAKCENCGVVVYDASRFDLESRPCPELVQHIWFYHEDGGDDGFKCACGAWTSSAKPPETPCSIMFGLKPNMHSGREVMIVPDSLTGRHDWDVHPGWKVGITPSICSQCKAISELDSSEISDWGCPGNVFTKGSLLDRRGGMVPTVKLGPNASQGISLERQALLDIQEYMKNYDGTRCAFTDIQEIIDEVLHE